MRLKLIPNKNEVAKFPVGEPVELAASLRVILAPNPSPMTHWGTNTYLLGEKQLVVVDPGPNIDHHLEAIVGSVGVGAEVCAILVTHAHLDHSALAPRLAKRTRAKVYAYGDCRAGRSPLMQKLLDQGMAVGAEGIDHEFRPDHLITHNQRLQIANLTIDAIWTPGHMSNHMCFACNGSMFTGDHVMQWASSLVSPPDGDLRAFFASCDKLCARDETIYFPGHGAPIVNPKERLGWLISHRKKRESAIFDALSSSEAKSIEEIAGIVYPDVADTLIPAAKRNILAHLIHLFQQDKLSRTDNFAADAKFLRLD